MRPGVRWRLVLATFLGCGGGSGSNSTTVHAGSRLKPIAYDVGGADANFDEWMDTKLGTECVFQTAEDGALRCLPSMNFPLVRIAYLDGACSIPIGITDATCTNLPHFSIQPGPPDACAPRQRVYGVTGPAAVPTSVFSFDIATGACAPDDAGDPALEAFVSVEAMPATAFVAASSKTRARTPGMSAEVREAEDGSWKITGFFDEAAGNSCWPADLKGTASLVCLPRPAIPVGNSDSGPFSDPTCQILATEASTCGPPPLVGLQAIPADVTACFESNAVTVHALEDGPTTLYSGNADLCGELPDPITLRHYRVGATLDPASFPAVEMVPVGSGRLRATCLGSNGVPFVSQSPNPVRDGLFDYVMDTEAGEGCAIWLFADGKYRCASRSWVGLPTDIIHTYEAPDCSGPELIPSAGGTACMPAAPKGALFVDTHLCAWFTVVEARSVEPTPVTLTRAYLSGAPGTCYASDFDTPATFYRLGTAVSPGDVFAEVKRLPRN